MDRRELLRTALQGGALAAVSLGGALTRVQEAAAAPTPLLPDDHFVTGTVTALSQSEMQVFQVVDRVSSTVTLRLDSNTHFCRQHCDNDPTRIMVGDRIESSGDLDESGQFVARWVNANSRYGHGRIAAVDQVAIAIELDHYYDQLVQLQIGPWSQVVSRDGFDVTSRYVDFCSAGDLITFTGTSPTPDAGSAEIWAYLVFLDQDAGNGPEARFGELR